MSARKRINSFVRKHARAAPVVEPEKYPVAYAYEFVRSYFGTVPGLCDAASLIIGPGPFGLPTDPGPAMLPEIVQKWAEMLDEPVEDVVVAMADGYLAMHGYRSDQANLPEAMARARENDWRDLGLPEPAH